MSSHDVVVVGAGLSGLAAAIRLRDKGHEPLLLEQSDGPGGRVRTDLVDGFRLDRGFQTLLTAYPVAQQLLDYEALDLRAFESGATVRVGNKFHRVADPIHDPGDTFQTLRAPVGSLRDKRAMLKFRNKVQKPEIDDLFAEAETTALARLEELGFSSKMINSFLRPLLTSLSLDPDLGFSSRSLGFFIRMIAAGETAIPAEGMGSIALQLAARLPADSIRFNATVQEVSPDHVVVDGDRIDAQAVVVATDAADAARLTGGEIEDPGTHALTTWWFAADATPLEEPTLVLDGNGTSPINHLAVLTQVAPSYSSDGRSLIAASAASVSIAEDAVRSSLTEWFGGVVEDWETLRVDAIERAHPRQAPGEEPDQSVRLASGLFVAGEHRQHPSINGALTSGCRSADAVAARLCRDC